jgi:signal-transduction protein with cAMP-binding, CBS, and nucleotidyltransferase domain
MIKLELNDILSCVLQERVYISFKHLRQLCDSISEKFPNTCICLDRDSMNHLFEQYDFLYNKIQNYIFRTSEYEQYKNVIEQSIAKVPNEIKTFIMSFFKNKTKKHDISNIISKIKKIKKLIKNIEQEIQQL